MLHVTCYRWWGISVLSESVTSSTPSIPILWITASSRSVVDRRIWLLLIGLPFTRTKLIGQCCPVRHAFHDWWVWILSHYTSLKPKVVVTSRVPMIVLAWTCDDVWWWPLGERSSKSLFGTGVQGNGISSRIRRRQAGHGNYPTGDWECHHQADHGAHHRNENVLG